MNANEVADPVLVSRSNPYPFPKNLMLALTASNEMIQMHLNVWIKSGWTAVGISRDKLPIEWYLDQFPQLSAVVRVKSNDECWFYRHGLAHPVILNRQKYPGIKGFKFPSGGIVDFVKNHYSPPIDGNDSQINRYIGTDAIDQSVARAGGIDFWSIKEWLDKFPSR